jgi:hypothetical protein
MLPSRHIAFGAGAKHQGEAEERQQPQQGCAAVA